MFSGASLLAGYAYDALGRRASLTRGGDGAVTNFSYDNDKLNRVTSIRENGVSSGAGVLIAYAYDPLSRRDSATRSSTNGAATDYTFDSASRLTALAHDFAGGATNDQSYGFSYTAASQLSLRSASNDAYTWPISAISRNYNRNGLNQYTTTTGAGATSFTHDQRGNLVSDGARRFCYDLENRLLRVDDASEATCSTPSLTLSYDPLGRLHELSDGSVTRQFLYDGDALIAEYDGASISRRFVHGPGVDEPVVQYEGADLNTRIHLFADRQGSIIAANGATTATYRYGPYGETDNWSGSRFRYTGQIVLDPDLGTATPARFYHYKGRVFDPVEGRFLQTDPVGYEDDLNLYQYVSNDPLNRADPTGRQEQERERRPVGWLSDPLAPTVRLVNQIASAINDAINAPSQSDSSESTPPRVPGVAPDGAPVYGGAAPGGRPAMEGEPGSWQVGPRQDRKYGDDGYPETDVDYSNDGGLHGEERPHSQDWGRPSDGSPPTAEDRGAPRPTTSGERFTEGSRNPDGYLPPDRRPQE